MNKRLIAIVCVQILLLLSIVGKYYYVATTGKLVTLETAPVDPRDLFHGDYVILNYKISSIEKGTVSTDLVDPNEAGTTIGDFPGEGDTVYVVLEKKKEPFYEAVGVFSGKPSLEGNQVLLKGKLGYSFDNKINIDYGIERYYVPENTGKKMEENRDLFHTVDIRVSPNGDAVIERLWAK